MKNLFNINKRKDAHKNLIVVAKIVKIIHIVFACVYALISLIYMIANGEYYGDVIIVALILTVVGFFLILFIGWIAELLLLGFSSIVDNQYDELTIKNKAEVAEREIPKNNDVYARLQQLHELKKAGIITEEEYEQKKKDTLQGL